MQLDYLEIFGFDNASLANISRWGWRIDGTNAATWSGSAAGMVTGWNGIGQAIDGPINIRFSYTPSVYRSVVIRTRLNIKAIGTERSLIINVGRNSLKITTAGLLKFAVDSGGPSWTSTGTAITTGWHDFELATDIGSSATTGKFTVKCDGVIEPGLSQAGVQTAPTGSFTPTNQCSFDNPDCMVDDFSIRVGTGTFDSDDLRTDVLGNPFMARLKPIAQGAFSQWDNITDTGVTNWEELDEDLLDEGTSALEVTGGGTVGFRDSWLFDSLPSGALAIEAMKSILNVRCLSPSTDFNHFLRINATNFDGATLDIDNLNYNGKGEYWGKTNPLTTEDFTVDEINAIELGIEKTAGTSSLRISQATIYVLYSTVVEPPPTIDAPVAFLRSDGLFLCSLFKVEPFRDNLFTTHYFTDHNAQLVFADGQTYTPAGGFTPSARQKLAGMREPNAEIVGILASSAITLEALQQKRYHHAKITEYVVDWRYPWAGAIETLVYWIEEVKNQGNFFTAQLSGVASRMRNKVGRIATRNCDFDLGDSRCTVNLFPLTEFSQVVTQVSDRFFFQASGMGAQTDGWFNFGFLTWLTGNNDFLTFEVRNYINATRQFELVLPPDRDIQVGDIFNVEPGCNKLFSGDCAVKFDNRVHFGGRHLVPGSDKVISSPPPEHNA